MRSGLRVAAVAACLLVLILAGLPLGNATAPARGAGAAMVGTAPLTAGASHSSASPSATASAEGPNCSLMRAHFGALYPGLAVPPGVPTSTFGGCPIGADDAAISLLSGSDGSGSNVTFDLSLPPVGSALGTTYAMFSLRLAVSALPCSLGGASVLEVQLVPPSSPLDGGPDANWSARTPAFDLAPPASCDSHCSNDTALVTLAGAAFCEDELLPAGFVPVPGAGFAPGSRLSVTLDGTPGGTAGLSLWINDSSQPSADVARSFSTANSSLGRPLEPLASVAGLGRDLWDGAGSVAATWTDCPLPAGPSTACTSYDPSITAAAGSIALLNATFAPAPGAGGALYGETSTSSSTAGCTSAAPACTGFNATAGDAYPSWWLGSALGGAAFKFGNGPSSGPSTLGGAAAQFGGGGSAPFLPLVVQPAPVTFQSPTTAVSAMVLDFTGVVNVTYDPFYCYASTTPAAAPIYAQLSSGTDTDGTWNSSFPVGVVSYSGTYPIAYTVGLSNGSSLYGGELSTVTEGTGSSCVFPAPAPPTVQKVTAVADGYRVTWNDSGGPLLGFEVNVTWGPTPTQAFVPQTWTGSLNGNVSTVLVLGRAGGTANATVTAEGMDGLSSTTRTNQSHPPATLSSLLISAAVSPEAVVGAGTTLNVSLNISGGLAPYNYSIDLGNGGTVRTGGVNGSVPIGFPLGSYQGTLDVRIDVTDAVGDAAAAPPVLVAVQTNPLGVPQSSQAGDGFVSLSWGTPRTPGPAVLGYFVYTTTNSSDAWRLASAGDAVGTFGGIEVTYTANHSASFLVGDGGVLFAQVLALGPSGLGALPALNLTLIGRPAPFTVGTIDAVGGGVAPFADNFSASVTGGSNDTLLSAVFSFPGFVQVAATIAGGNGSFVVNASYTFLGPGTFVVTLHVTDDEFDVGVVSTTVFVSSGVPPSLAVSVLNAPAYNGTPVLFEATASGGSGDDGFNWSFGDGAYANQSSPVHVYAVPGTYSAVVRVTDLLTQGVNETVLPVTVFTAPIVFVSVFPGPNGTDSFDFRASVGGGSGPSQVVWTFGDGTIAHGSNVSHDYDAPGSYLVNVTATDPAGHAGTTEYPLYVASPTSTGGGGASGVPTVEFWLVVAIASGAVLVAIVLAVRRRPPAEAQPVGEFEEEDGAVSLS